MVETAPAPAMTAPEAPESAAAPEAQAMEVNDGGAGATHGNGSDEHATAPAEANKASPAPVAEANDQGRKRGRDAIDAPAKENPYPDIYPYNIGFKKFEDGREIMGYMHGIWRVFGRNAQKLPEVSPVILDDDFDLSRFDH